jgi:hypothetical protein
VIYKISNQNSTLTLTLIKAMKLKNNFIYKVLIALCFFSFWISETKAQFYPNTYRSESDWQLNIGVQGLIPPFPPRKSGIGGTISVRRFIENSISARATVGYNMVKDLYKKNDFTYVPAQLGIIAYVQPNFYLSGDAGFAKSNRALRDKLAWWLVVTPGIGYSFPDSGLDLAAQYDILHRNTQFVGVAGIKLSYTFNIGGGY